MSNLPSGHSLFSPTGISPRAQGCEERATLGRVWLTSQPQRGCVSSTHNAPPCPNPIPPFTSISSSQPKNAVHSSAIHRCAKPPMLGLVPPPASLDARLCGLEALKITFTFSHDTAGRFPKRIGSKKSNVPLRSGLKSNPQISVSSRGRRDTAYFQLVPPTSTRCVITSRGKRNITSNGVFRMNSESCYRNTARNGMNVTSGNDSHGSLDTLPQRGSASQPGVGMRHEFLPWGDHRKLIQPQRGCGHVPCRPAATQPRWGWMHHRGIPRVVRRSAVQPWALGQIPVGEFAGTNPFQVRPDTANPFQGRPDTPNPFQGRPDTPNPFQGRPDTANPFQGRPDTPNPSLWDGIPLGYICLLPQRGSASQPGVARNELPRGDHRKLIQPQRGCGRVSWRSAATQPRWGWMHHRGIPRVGRRSAVQPWALGQIPVGEFAGTTPALIAEYQTQLPGKQLLQRKLHEFYQLQQPAEGGDA